MKRKSLYTPIEWSNRIGIVIIDDDGWRRTKSNFNTPIDIIEFSKRLKFSTIKVTNGDLYRDYLWEIQGEIK